MTEKKYPCLYGLKGDCEVRKFVEENNQLPQALAAPNKAEATVVERAMTDTKVLQFDDKKTAKEIGEAAAEGALGVLAKTLNVSMGVLKPQFMIHFCSMCPIRIEKCKAVKGDSK